MNLLNDLKKSVEQAQDKGDMFMSLNGTTIQIFSGKPIQFNATLKGNRFPTVKFEERSPGKFTVAVAPEDGASIDYTQARVFTMDEPVEHMAAAFPQSRGMKQLVNCLANSQ